MKIWLEEGDVDGCEGDFFVVADGDDGEEYGELCDGAGQTEVNGDLDLWSVTSLDEVRSRHGACSIDTFIRMVQTSSSDAVSNPIMSQEQPAQKHYILDWDGVPEFLVGVAEDVWRCGLTAAILRGEGVFLPPLDFGKDATSIGEV